jgi:hypothetical protein
MTVFARLMWLLAGIIGTGASAAAMTWYVVSMSLAGFNTSQQTLSDHMILLQGSLDKQREISDEKISEARGDLVKEIAGLSNTMKDFNGTLSKRLEENSNQLASLNANLGGVDKRLTESIARQQAFETLVLQRIVFQGPIDNTDPGKVIAKWSGAGYNGDLLKSMMNDGSILMEWERLTRGQQK